MDKANFFKKALLILLVTVVSVCLLSISLGQKELYASKAITVFLDPGHGGRDPGAVHNGLRESDVNLAIAMRLKNLLENNGYRVIMRRTDDTYMSLDDIAKTANRSGADLFLSIHNNASLSPASAGTETYWSANGVGGSSQFATAVQSNLVGAIGRPNRGVKSANFRVIKNTNMTAALVECAFLSNVEEAKLLKNSSFLDKAARGLFNGIHSYAKNMKPSTAGGTPGAAGQEYVAQKIQMHIDAPGEGQTISGQYELTGWALEQGGINSPEIDAVHVYDGPAAGSKNLIGIADYGHRRPDVAEKYGNPAFANSGFSLTIDCNRLSKGTHVIHVYAHNKQLGWAYATAKVNVISDGSGQQLDTPAQGSADPQALPATEPADGNYESTGPRKVIITVDEPKVSQTVSGNFALSGWAIEQSAANTTGITSVHVYDGRANGEQNLLGIAEYGLPRDDVASAYGRSGFTNSGFQLNIDSTKMQNGTRTLYIYAHNSALGWKHTTIRVNVANGDNPGSQEAQTDGMLLKADTDNNSGYISSGVQRVLINVDQPQKGQQVDGNFSITGWAVERSAVNSTGITAVHIYNGQANGEENLLGIATYGLSRTDVGDYFGKANLANSGFRLDVDSAKLSDGNHTLYIYAYNQNLGWKHTTVDISYGGSTQPAAAPEADVPAAAPASSGKAKAVINIDTPKSGQDVSGSFELSGWAIEESATGSTGITAIHVYNGPAAGEKNMLGVAQYGISRPDVAAKYGKSNFTSSGFKLSINTGRLSSGTNTLYIYAHNQELGWSHTKLKVNVAAGGTAEPAASSAPAASERISNATSMIGYLPVTEDQLVRIFEVRGSSKVSWARRLAPLYIKWGQEFNVRADIAWAQMVHETGFLEYTGVAKPEWNNFAGLGVVGPEGVGLRFDNENLGVLAHFVHIAWYVYPSAINKYCSPKYNSRYTSNHFHNGDSTVNCFNGRWAPSPTYTDQIIRFANMIHGR